MIRSFYQRVSFLRLLVWLLPFLAPAALYAQVKPDVTGIVLDPQGEKIPGVTVKAIQASGGKLVFQMTDEKGWFHFDNLGAGERYNFTFTSIGYKPQQLDGYTIRKGETINLIVRMRMKDDSLAQVVVVGYGTQKKSQVTGAIAQVGPEVFENRPVTSIGQALQGAIPNLNITFGDGQPGRSATFNVRGFTSINTGSPLILIDGTPGDINLVNPEDVASVTVLKDAASAAIYGARAAYGVILVTTRKAKSGQLQVRYSGNFGWGQPTRLPQVIKDPLEAATIQNDAYKGYAGSDAPGMLAVIEYLQKRKADPSLPELGVDATGNWIRGANTDWYGLFYNKQQAFSKHFLSLAGGKGNTNYYLSAGYLKQTGAFKVETDDYKRYNLRLKVDNQVAKWLKIYDNVEMAQGTYDAPNKFVSGGFNIYRYLSLFANPYEAIKTPNGNYTQAGAVTFGQLEKGGRTLTKDRQLKNTIGFGTNFLDSTLRINGDYTVLATQSRGNIQTNSVYYETKPGNLAPFVATDYYSSSYIENFDQVVNLYAEYERNLGQHHLRGLVGFNQEMNTYDYFNARRDANITPDKGALNLTSGVASVGDSKEEWAIRGVFYRLNYDFKDRYLLEFNGRYDGSSRFPDSSRYGFFPSVSAGWLVSREPFFQSAQKAINNLKLRASYGSLGNQQVGAYAFTNPMGVYKVSDILDGAQPLAINAPGLLPLNFTWETATTLDFGIDFATLNNRMDVGFDWYNRKTTKMLTKGKTLPAVLGASAPKQNAADLSTKGWELSLKWHDDFKLGNKPFSYNFSFVLSDSRSFITKFDNPNKSLTDYYVGQEIGEIWGYKTLGFFQTDDEYKNYSVNQQRVQSTSYSLNGHPMAGDLRFANLNNDTIISNGQNTADNPGDMSKIGNSQPRFAYGFGAGASWNGISLDVFVQGIGKMDFWPGVESGNFWGFYNRWNQPVYDHIVNDYWTPENRDAYFPRLRAYDALNNTRQLGVAQTRYLQNAAYLRLKNVTLGYMLPARWMRKAGVSSSKIFFSGQNLFEFTHLSKAFDPEAIGDKVDTNTSNGNGFLYPVQRTYTFGLEVNF